MRKNSAKTYKKVRNRHLSRCYAYKSEHFQKAVCQVKFLVKLVDEDRVHVCEPNGKNPDHEHIESGKTVNTNYKAANGEKLTIDNVFAPKINQYVFFRKDKRVDVLCR